MQTSSIKLVKTLNYSAKMLQMQIVHNPQKIIVSKDNQKKKNRRFYINSNGCKIQHIHFIWCLKQ